MPPTLPASLQERQKIKNKLSLPFNLMDSSRLP